MSRTEFRRFPATGVAALDRQGTRIALDVQQSGTPVEVHDLTNGNLVNSIYRLNSSPAIFSADGTEPIVPEGDVLADHPLGADVALRRVCDLVGRDLTRAEWQTYASGFPYRRIRA
ncbi:hypothetical protein [Actinoplanes sp. NPDC020271]|uniref:hypothetical protein n=1 Tax=Actinoplanes sp. NPDC020271 TaxID=3363896 RepID=UPI00379809B6